MITVMERQGNETKATHEEKHKTGVQIKQGGQQLLNNQASLPPSSTSSPSHEFTFVSLPPSNNDNNYKTKYSPAPSSPPPPFAATIDLSPADEIFFHGHLLPLPLIHPNVSASSSRSSTNSLDSCTFTLKDELLHDHDDIIIKNKNNDDNDTNKDDRYDGHPKSNHVLGEGKTRSKSKSFSYLFPKWRKHHHSSDHHHHHHEHDHQETDEYDDDHDHKQKFRKSKFDIVKRYMRLVKPLIPFRHKRSSRNAHEFLRQPAAVSFGSGSLRVRKKKELMMRGRGSEYLSAPVSIRTSPTNSGILVASGNITPTNKYNSTMEELHAAIQGAIAHCKKSITEEGEKEHAADKTI